MSKVRNDHKLPFAKVPTLPNIKVSDINPDAFSLDDLEKLQNGRPLNVEEAIFESIEAQKRPSKKFWKHTRVGRFLSGRTKAGRIFRRVGLGALGISLPSFLGIDVSGLSSALSVESTGNLDQEIQALSLIKEIVLAIGAIITTITKAVDVAETTSEKADELEEQEHKKTLIRKATSSMKSKIVGE